MKRGKFAFSEEILRRAIPELPKDFKVSGIKYDFIHNVFEIYGYSDTFTVVTAEGAEPIVTAME